MRRRPRDAPIARRQEPRPHRRRPFRDARDDPGVRARAPGGVARGRRGAGSPRGALPRACRARGAGAETGANQHVWLETLAAEHENLRAALDRYDGEAESLRFAAALVLFWFIRGFYREALQRLEHTLAAREGERSRPRAVALWGAGFLYSLFGDEERALPLLEESLALARELGDESSVARCLDILGLYAFFANEPQRARELLEESVVLARRSGDNWCLADALGTLGSIYPLQGEAELADSVASEGLAIARRFGDRQGMRMSLFGLALAAARRGELEAARARAEEGLAISREIGDGWFISYFLWILAGVELDSGNPRAARADAEESLQLARELAAPLLLVCALRALAAVHRAERDYEGARTHLLEAEEIGRGAVLPHSYLASVQRGLGELAAARGDGMEARRRLEEALRLAEGVGDSWEAERVHEALARLVK